MVIFFFNNIYFTDLNSDADLSVSNSSSQENVLTEKYKIFSHKSYVMNTIHFSLEFYILKNNNYMFFFTIYKIYKVFT